MLNVQEISLLPGCIMPIDEITELKLNSKDTDQEGRYVM
jgi:hypothetical protein